MTPLLHRLTANRLTVFGLLALLCVFALGLSAPFLPLAAPDIIDTANRFKRPFSEGYILGTDHLGRDLLSRLLWGARLSIAVGAAAAALAALIGSTIGVIAGYYAGRVDGVLMRLIDVLMAFPYILLALAIVAVLGPGLLNALLAVVVVNIPFFARNVRGVTVALAAREFVYAAKLSGMSNMRIILSELLPNIAPFIVVAMSTTMGWMILETAGLSFLGLGSQPPQADLGSMLGEARSALISHPHTSVVPGAMIFLIVMGVNLLGDGIRDALDPRLRDGVLTSPSPMTSVAVSEDATEPDGEAMLALRGLHTRFENGDHRLHAVNGVSLTVAAGECVGIIGESGCGKSVTALSVMRLAASPAAIITAGDIYYRGEALLRLPYEKLRRLRGNRVAYVFQDPLTTLHPLMTIGAQLTEAISVHKPLPREEAVARAAVLLADVAIPNPTERLNAYPHELSGGMRQRVGIAMALANDPDVLIADEPTTALDVTVQAQVLTLLARLRAARGLAVVFITHDFGVVSELCDYAAVMYGGEIVEEGRTSDLLSAPAHPYTKRLIDCVPLLGGGRRRLPSISGLPPRLNAPPDGCAFAPRCPRAGAECRQGDIPIIRHGRRAVRCLHPEAAIQ